MPPKTEHNPLNDLKWFFIIFFVLGLLWFLSGGLRSDKKEDPLITPAGTTYGRDEVVTEGFSWKNFFFPWLNNGSSTLSGSQNIQTIPAVTGGSVVGGSSATGGSIVNAGGATTGGSSSIYNIATERVKDEYNNIEYSAPKSDLYGMIQIKSVRAGASGYETVGSPDNEYLYLYASKDNKTAVNLTGMTVKSPITLHSAEIGQAVKVYYPSGGTQNYKQDIVLNPGDYVYILTGKSPVLMSFQLNRCMAYLINGLPSSCPTPLNYPLPTGASSFSDRCLDYMRNLRSCVDYSYADLPTTLEHDCRVFIDEKTSYTRCVQDFGSQTGFLGNIWYIYLDRSQSLWKSSRDITELRDQNGNLVDIVSR